MLDGGSEGTFLLNFPQKTKPSNRRFSTYDVRIVQCFQLCETTFHGMKVLVDHTEIITTVSMYSRAKFKLVIGA